MRFLPKANPLYEKISVANIVMPELLEKLARGGFTGYLSHSAPDFEACCLIAKGKLLSTVSRRGGQEKSGFEAIVMLFEMVLAVGGEINLYQMTTDLAVCAHSIVSGQRLFDGDDVRQVDIKGVLAQLKVQGINGAVLFYTPERHAIMFYKDGTPIGFYHDGSASIDAQPDETRKVAALPGARIDVCTTKTLEELLKYDLFEMVNLGKLWETAQSRRAAAHAKAVPLAQASSAVTDEGSLRELIDDLIDVASAYLSKAGRDIIEQRLQEGGGPALFLDSVRTVRFLADVDADARAVDSEARIAEMIDLMRSEIAGRVAG